MVLLGWIPWISVPFIRNLRKLCRNVLAWQSSQDDSKCYWFGGGRMTWPGAGLVGSRG